MNQQSPVTPVSTSPLYVRSKAAAGRYGVSHSWFWWAVKEGLLPRPQTIGQRMSLWDTASLDAAFAKLLASREPTKTA